MSYDQCERVFSENLEEGQTIRLGTSTTDFLSLHLHHQYYSSPATNTAAAVGTQAGCTGVILNSYCQDPRQGWHSSSSTSAVDNVDIDYEVQDEDDNDYEVLVGLINVHAEKEEEDERPWPSAAAAPVSSWEWPRFGGTLESIVDQAPCNLVPLVVHMPEHEVDHTCLIEQPGNELEEEEEEDDQVLVEDEEYHHHTVAPEVTDMENTVLQFKPSTCNAESMTVDQEEDEHDDQYFSAGNTNISSRPLPLPPPPPPPPYQYSQREAKKITEKRQMHRGKSSTISSNKRSKVLLHNESERKRRDKISEKMEILHNLVPNFNKQTDKASMLDQVIEYVKKLQAQHQMMNMSSGMFNNNMPAAVHPMMMMQYMTTMQQQQQQHHQQQMSMMAQIGMGMGMGMGMGPGMVMMPTGGSGGMHPNLRRE